VQTNMFVISNEESGGIGYKYRRHANEGFSSESIFAFEFFKCLSLAMHLCSLYVRVLTTFANSAFSLL
jgi:hypothetical protein